MRALTVIPKRTGRRNLKDTHARDAEKGKVKSTNSPQPHNPVALQRHPRPRTHNKLKGRIGRHIRRAFTPLIDAKAASQLLGVPYTWLLAQARANNIPHHRLGHYVRFDPDDLQTWLRETRSEPYAGRHER
ncbi:MAG: helix-turn-helix domain-containing protein [Solirubrobacteraceae bacterium]